MNELLFEAIILAGLVLQYAEDRIPDLIYSQVIWKAVKGEESIMPAPRRSAFLATHGKK